MDIEVREHHRKNGTSFFTIYRRYPASITQMNGYYLDSVGNWIEFDNLETAKKVAIGLLDEAKTIEDNVVVQISTVLEMTTRDV